MIFEITANKVKNMFLKKEKRTVRNVNTLLKVYIILRSFGKKISSKKVAKVIKNVKCFKCEKRYKD